MAFWPDLSGNSPVSNPNYEVEPGLETELLFKQGFVTLSSAQFSNPKYMDDNINNSLGFSLGDYATGIFMFTSTGTGLVVAYEQTFDQTGQSGWFAVAPVVYTSGNNGIQNSSAASVNVGYVFPLLGCRMRVRVTALASGVVQMQAALITGVLPPPQNMMPSLLNLKAQSSALPTRVGNATNGQANMDDNGRLLVTSGFRGLQDFNRQAITVTTETVLIAAVASTTMELRNLTIANRDTVAHTVDVRDALAGTIRKTYIVPAGDTREYDYATGMPALAQNTAWTVQLREAATTAVEISSFSNRLT